MSADIREALKAAEVRGMALFDAIEREGLIAPGKSETDLDREIYILARQRFGVEQHWHKRVVRAGINTLCTFYDDPPEQVVGADDTVYVDLGPVFAGGNRLWEADIGRTYAVGSDPDKHRLVADLPRIFDIVQAHYHATPDITGAALYAFARSAARGAGWEFGGVIAGHVVGEFPHAKRIPGERDFHRIAPANPAPLSAPDANGNERHWILEIHLVDRARQFGGFYERLL